MYLDKKDWLANLASSTQLCKKKMLFLNLDVVYVLAQHCKLHERYHCDG
ncbi:hypothetical protein PROSTU_04326 [Providencia stuartii ATCC 25827]|uniref:Uncharacterized protein n=1 Tax=Providencia stuartii ATCC 25827 TaxID=471874 RepID=A0AA87CRQ8_PROST|nr:hypothetical protein PROSTU_04326 [Providencia stuartii ATCC 25827]